MIFQESSISLDHLRFVMQSLPREVHMTRRGMHCQKKMDIIDAL